MYNIATIYRFNTPFLDIFKERDNLISVIKKIEKSIEFDGINYRKEKIQEGNFFRISLYFFDNLGTIDFYYVSNISSNSYYLPIFKLDINLNEKFLINNDQKQSAVKFLNNIFECFDGLAEMEFLIDLDNTFYYTHGIFKTKIYPNYDFSDIEKIRESFESSDGIILVEDFVNKFSKREFILSYEKSEYYYKLHSLFLYFIYLVYLMYQNIEKTYIAKEELNNDFENELYDSQKKLMKERLLYLESIHNYTFEQYKEKLDLFFKLF